MILTKRDLKIVNEEHTPVEVANGLPPEFGSDAYENDPRLDGERDELESKQEEMLRRQDRIQEIRAHHPATTYSTLITMLKGEGFKRVSMGTIHRDMEAIQQQAIRWADRQASGGLVQECREAVIRFKKLIERLDTDMGKALPRDRPAYAKQIHDLTMSIYYLKEQGGTFQAIKQAHEKYKKFMSTPEAQRAQVEFIK